MGLPNKMLFNQLYEFSDKVLFSKGTIMESESYFRNQLNREIIIRSVSVSQEHPNGRFDFFYALGDSDY